VLVGRDADRLADVAADLKVRSPKSTVEILTVDMNSAEELRKGILEVAAKPIDLALVAQGSLTDQKKASADVAYLASELTLNAISVTVCAELLVTALETQGHGTLGVIGSVAGDRGRAYNYAYGASKALVAAFVAGLQQRLAATKVKVCLIKPGPTATPMTANHRGRMADPALVAKQIVAGLGHGKRVIYTPKVWAFIMFIVRLIPFAIFKRLNF